MNHSKPMRHPEIVAQDLGDETLLYDAHGQAMHVLNATACHIWQLCDGRHTLADIEQSLRDNFAIPEDHNLSQDIQQTLNTLTAKGLLQS